MIVTKENYEVWMLDYLEGKLLGKDLLIFEDFLSEHPELREDAEGAEKMALTPGDRFFLENTRLKAKMLKQVIDEEEQTCFEAAEGILPADKKGRLEKRVGSSERLKQKLEHYREAKLTANFQQVFPDKEMLKQEEPVVKTRSMWVYLAAAAAVAGLIYLVLPTEESTIVSHKMPLSQLVKKPVEKTTKESTVVVKTEPTKAELIKEEPVVKPAQEQPAVSAAKPMVAKTPVQPKPKTIPKPQPAKEPLLAQNPSQEVVTPAPKTELPKPNLAIITETPKKDFLKNLVAKAEYENALVKAGTSLLNRISGRRLTISKEENQSTKVNFESKLLGFQTKIK